MKYKIKELITDKISGEWGEESVDGEGNKVLRTTNFTNLGKINFENVVIRKIEVKRVNQKHLKYGDVIIEKSGGSPTQPVGRVVYFDLETNDKYLCNNFTAILRPRNDLVNSKYFFYQLHLAHVRGKTLKYQNKTTGIINLKLDNYLEEKIEVPSLSDQLHIANTLSKVENLIARRKESICLLDEFLKSTFLEMFGDPVRNEKGWKIHSMDEVVDDIKSGTSYGGEEKVELASDELGVLKINAVTSGILNPYEFKAVKKDLINKQIITLKKDMFLISRANTRELVAACCIVPFDYPKLFIPDKLWSLGINKKLALPDYLNYLFKNESFRDVIRKQASGGHDSMLNISMGKFRSLNLTVPSLELQNQFGQIVEKTETLKVQYQQSLQELEQLYGSLSQRAFRGELGVKVTQLYEESKYLQQ